VTSLGVTATWTPEATEQTDDSPALLQPAIVCKKGQAFVPVSFELYEDSDIAQQLGTVFADAKNVHESLSFTLNQTNGPTGIISSIVTAAGANIIATAPTSSPRAISTRTRRRSLRGGGRTPTG
jgi:HK97 family phage major capsid protein